MISSKPSNRGTRPRLTVPVDASEPSMSLDIGRTVIAKPTSRSVPSAYTLGPRVAPLGRHDAIRTVRRGGRHATQPIFRFAKQAGKKVGTCLAQPGLGREAERLSPVQTVSYRISFDQRSEGNADKAYIFCRVWCRELETKGGNPYRHSKAGQLIVRRRPVKRK